MRAPRPALALIPLSLLLALVCGCARNAAALNAPITTDRQVALAELSISRTETATASPTPIRPTAIPSPTATPTAIPTPTRIVPERRPVAVVVENERQARPQTGLGDADVVYEAVAEFNLTRFVAVFTDSSADKVGPVRSARAYHASIAAEFGAILAHCLQVPSVSPVVADTSVDDFDGCRISNPPGFSRDWNRTMPHNLYVNVPTLRDVSGGDGTYGGFARRGPWPNGLPSVSEISFVYPEEHLVVWRYDPGQRQYLRWQDGEPHIDIAGQQIAVTSVVVQFVTVENSSYYGEGGYRELTLVGKGEGLVLASGEKREVTWRRDSLTNITSFYDVEGKVVLLPPGHVFVQLVAIGTALTEKP